MAELRKVGFPFPVKGLNRNWSFRDQPLLTSPDMLNVRAYDTIGDRVRGGQRPGVDKLYDEQLGGTDGSPIRLLSQVTSVKKVNTQEGIDEDNFDRPDSDDPGEDWEDPVWIATPAAWGIHKNQAFAQGRDDTRIRGCVRKDLSFSDSHKYSIQVTVQQTGKDFTEHGRFLWARMDDDNPDLETDGVEAYIRLRCSDYTYSQGRYQTMQTGDVTFKSYISGEETSYSVETIPWGVDSLYRGYGPHKFKMVVDDDNVKVYWDGFEVISQDVEGLSGQRVGFGLRCRPHDNKCFADDWLATGVMQTAEPVERRVVLVAGAGGKIYSEATGVNEFSAGTLTQVTGDVASIADDKWAIMATEQENNLYIADREIRIEGTGGDIAGNGTDLTDDLGISDWRTYDIDVDTDKVKISAGTDDVTDGTYGITSVAEEKLVLSSSAGGAGTCAYAVQRAPKIYDPVNNAVSLWTPTKGTLPLGCSMIALYRNRIVLTGDPGDVHNWYMCRQGDPTDFEYGADDEQTPIAGHNAKAGKVGEPITAVVPWRDDYMLFGCAESIWVMRGDPATGGLLDNICRGVGIVDKFAWCIDPSSTIYFLGPHGLYMMGMEGNYGPMSAPKAISPTILPDDLVRVNTELKEVNLAWDGDLQGVFIFITTRDPGTSVHWFYDVRQRAFFPDVLPSDCGPTRVFYYLADVVQLRKLILGGRTGYLRIMDRTKADDDGTAISSHVVFAPQRLTDDHSKGVLTEIQAALDETSSDVAYEIRAGDTHQGAIAATASLSGVWKGGGMRPSVRTRVRAGSACLRLASSGHGSWAVENIIGKAKVAGKQR